MNAIVFLTKEPDNEILDNADKLSDTYSVFIIMDNNKAKIPNNNKIKFLKIDDLECEENNFINSGGCSSGLWSKDPYIWKQYNIKNPSAWDKGLYYFCRKDKNYKNVWFIEDDVLIPKVSIFNHIDKLYNNSDFLSEACDINTSGDINDWHWKYAKETFNTPWYRSMICTCRMSKKLLSEINNYVINNKMLMFDEIMFPTIAKQSNLIVHNPKELSGIKYWDKWDEHNTNLYTLYHPVKKESERIRIKNILLNNDSMNIDTEEMIGGEKNTRLRINYNKDNVTKVFYHK